MRIAFDLDGTIAEGKYLIQPERAHEAYMQLEPYDKDTIRQLYNITQQHDCYIITSRSYPNAVWSIITWLDRYSLDGGPHKFAGIIPNIEQKDKWHLAGCLKCDIIVDDSPRVWQDARTSQRCYIPVRGIHPEFILMDNPAWLENQACQDYVTGRFASARCFSWKELGARIDSIATSELYKSTATL